MTNAIIGIVVGVVTLVILWVVVAATRKVPHLDESDAKLSAPSPDWLKTAYDATISLYIEVDREIYQINTIFLSASLIIMGWVITSLDKLDFVVFLIAGSASMLMVGVATVFKFRLRIFNLVHIAYLKRLEQAFMANQIAVNYWGLHHVRTKLKAGANPLKFASSIHGIMIIYFILFVATWIALAASAYTHSLAITPKP